MPSALEKRYFDSAEEFLAAIRRSNEQWWPEGSDRSPWVFRGIGDAENWKLLPSAWRTEGNPLSPLIRQIESADLALPFGYGDTPLVHRCLNWESAELEALFQFAELANSSGFTVPHKAFNPNRSPLLNGHRMDVKVYDLALDGDTTREKLSYLAQHHGIPTRMLDWTESPLIAAFFASSPLTRPRTSKAICVWALDTDALLFNRGVMASFNGIRVRVHRPSRSDNLYLHSQGGLLTEMLGSSYWFIHNDGHWPALEDVLKNADRDPPMLIGHILCAEEVPKLARLLEREGIYSAALMPSMDNVALTIKSRWLTKEDERSSRVGV